jgi:hypothetical protein
LSLQFVWAPLIIRVEERDPVAPGRSDSRVARRRHTAVLLTDQPDAISETRERFRRVVGRAVIHDDDFEILKVLRQDAFHGIRKAMRAVEYRNDN